MSTWVSVLNMSTQVSAIDDLVGSIWSSGFTDATLYAFLDGYLSALLLAWPLWQVGTLLSFGYLGWYLCI